MASRSGVGHGIFLGSFEGQHERSLRVGLDGGDDARIRRDSRVADLDDLVADEHALLLGFAAGLDALDTAEREQDAPQVTKSAHRMLLMTSLTLLVGGPWGCSEQASEPVVTLPDPVDSNTGDLDGVAVAPLDGIDGPETTECDPAAMRVIDTRPWTGGGVQVAVELLEAGEPVSDPESTSVARVLDDGARPRVDT